MAPIPALPSAGQTASGVYAADSGFAGAAYEQRWVETYHAQLVASRQAGSGARGSGPWRRWLAGKRPIIETVFARLLEPFRLETERPHTLEGFQARLAARIGLHNVCIWLNRQHGRPDLAFADLLSW
jgi:hypothetical protein